MPDRTAPSPHRPGEGPVAHVNLHRAASGKVRWIASLAPQADAAYAAHVADVVPSIERRLAPGVIADRASARGAVVRLAPWRLARRRWTSVAMHGLGGPVRALVVADVRDCFASIGPCAVARALAEAGAHPASIERVVHHLRAFDDAGVRGLPIGPAASAALGNVVLARLDDALGRRGVPHLRWVDDVLAFAPSRREAGRCLDDLHRAAAGLGLRLHEGKTRIVVEPAEARALVGGWNSPGAGPGVA